MGGVWVVQGQGKLGIIMTYYLRIIYVKEGGRWVVYRWYRAGRIRYYYDVLFTYYLCRGIILTLKVEIMWYYLRRRYVVI